MPKRKYAVDYTSFQKRFKKANGGKGWLQKCQEVWTKVKNNPQALTRKYNELGKSEKSSQRAFFRLFKPCGDVPREASQSNTEAPAVQPVHQIKHFRGFKRASPSSMF